MAAFTSSELSGISGGLGLASAAFSFFGGSAEAKYKKAYQQYANKMVQLSNAGNQDAITMNEIMYNQNSANEALMIQVKGLAARGSSEVSAAAAGVKGKSVNVGLAHIIGSAEQAEYKRQKDYKYAMLGFDAQRSNSAMQAAMQTDNSYIASPNVFGTLLSSGGHIASLLGAF